MICNLKLATNFDKNVVPVGDKEYKIHNGKIHYKNKHFE